MEREGEASEHLGQLMFSGHAGYHPDGYLYCPGQGVFELQARRRKCGSVLRWLFDAARVADISLIPPGGWVQLPTYLEEMRQVES